MSDLNQLSEDTTNTNEQQEGTVSTSENDFESKESAKTTEDESHDSEYEDVEDDEINETSILTCITNKSPLKIITDEDELHINIKPRRINKKEEDDEHSEGSEDDDDDNQNVPNTKLKISRDLKQANKNEKVVDDDNNTQSPAYIPRKGKFYEHDDRTLDENDQSKQEISRNENRFYKDSDAKWQHDLYFQNEQTSKSQHPTPRRNYSHSEHRHNYNREQLPSSDYMPRSQKDRNDYHQQPYHNNNRRSVSHENYNKSHTDRLNNRDTNINKETQAAPRQQRRDYDPYQIDERTFHRRRNFTNSQFQQQDNVSKFNEYRNYEGKNQEQNRDLRKYESYDNKTNLPPRLQTSNNYRTLPQKQQYQQNPTSNNVSNIERPKRYSNMRNNMTNSSQQQTPSSQIQHYQDQRSNHIEQNDWPQAPPPPTSYLRQQIITPQMFYQQQTSRYVSMNYSQGSSSQQFTIPSY